MNECTWCGNDLEPDEIESPRRDDDGDPMCDACYHDEYMFSCCKCENYAPLSERDNVGDIFVIVDEDEAELPIGIYEILSLPYWSSDMLSSDFIKYAIKKVSDYTFGMSIENINYAAGHFCQDCQNKIRETIQNDFEKVNP
jgi:hypothetical protein